MLVKSSYKLNTRFLSLFELEREMRPGSKRGNRGREVPLIGPEIGDGTGGVTFSSHPFLYVFAVTGVIGAIALAVGFGVWAGTRVNPALADTADKVSMLMDQVGILMSAEPAGMVTVWRGMSTEVPAPLALAAEYVYNVVETDGQPWAEAGVPTDRYLSVNTTGEYEIGIFFSAGPSSPSVTNTITVEIIVEDMTMTPLNTFTGLLTFSPAIRSDIFIASVQVTQASLIRWRMVNNNVATLQPFPSSFWVTRLADLPA